MPAFAKFHAPLFGREKLNGRTKLPRHRHRDGYITIVLAGGYHEAGLDGRRDLAPGSVIVHRPYDAHLNHIGMGGAELINLPLPAGLALPIAFEIDDPDAVARLAETDPLGAAASLEPRADLRAASDWPDRLAGDLAVRPDRRLGEWADEVGLAAATLSRGFRKAYGVTAARFRAEARAQRALHLIVETVVPLAAIAVECGFSDQPHLTRSIVQLTGRSPGFWRGRSIPFKTGRAQRR